MNFALFLEMRARSAPDSIAAVDSRRRLTFAELDACAARFANLLRERGAARGARVAVCLPNRVEAVIAFVGALKAGVVAVPLNWRLHGAELARVLGHCTPSLLVTTEEKAASVPGPIAWPVLDVGTQTSAGTFWPAIESCEPRFASVGCQASDIANLLYTSGTTALPKAAIHTHGMRVAIAAAMADCFSLSSRDVALAVSPIFHTSGLSVLSNAIFAGCPVVLLERWNLGELLQAIETERVTFMHLIGTIVIDIARAPEHLFDRDTSSVRFTWGGGHSLDAQSLAIFERRIGGVFLQGYSRTEGGLAYNPLDRKRRRFDANGFGNLNSSEIAVVDPATMRRCAVGETGEIVVRGDGVSPGYWDGEFVRMRSLYDGGWQPTGDLGCIDEEGSLHFLGRNDLMIKTGGENVYPAEIEAVLLGIPGVADAVVVGLPDERLGHRVGALVVRADARLTESDVERGCREALAGFKIPRTIGFVDRLPRLGTQKVDLAACRESLLGTAARAAAAPVPSPQAGKR